VDRKAFEKKLRDRRAELIAAGPIKIEPNRKDPTTVGVADEDEQALSEMLQAVASNRNRDAAREIRMIDRALRKLADDPESYGICEDCEEEIAPKRLDLMPWVELCAECQAKVDPKRGQARTKVTDFR
jgi:DnaK suppressor protein